MIKLFTFDNGRMEILSSNQSKDYVPSLILFEILFLLLLPPPDYLNMTVSNKKALATLDTLHK